MISIGQPLVYETDSQALCGLGVRKFDKVFVNRDGGRNTLCHKENINHITQTITFAGKDKPLILQMSGAQVGEIFF